MAFLCAYHLGATPGGDDDCRCGAVVTGDWGKGYCAAGGNDEGAPGRKEYGAVEKVIFFALNFFEYVFKNKELRFDLKGSTIAGRLDWDW